MKEYDAYLFDADGTLMDTRPLIVRAFYHMRDVMGGTFPDDVVHGLIGLPVLTQMRMLLGGGREDAEYMRARDVYDDFMLERYDRYVRAFPGAVEVVGELHRRGKKLAVVTSRRMKSLGLFLEHIGLREFFDIFVTPESTEQHKPDPQPALFALDKLGVEAKDALFVGDAVFDIQCGHSAGTDTAFVVWGGMDPSGWDVRPDWTAEQFSDLLPSKDAHENH